MIFKSKNDKKKLAIIRGLSKLRTIEYKLAQMEDRLNTTIANGIIRVAELKDKNLNIDAELLAAEIASKRGMLTEIMRIRTGLERLRLRLETVLLVGESRENMRQIPPLLSEIKKSGIQKIPEVAVMFSELEELISDVYEGFDDGSITSIDDVTIVSFPSEVERILKEAELVAQGRERKKLPLPPGS